MNPLSVRLVECGSFNLMILIIICVSLCYINGLNGHLVHLSSMFYFIDKPVLQ